jgi:hypothetical protein
MGVRSICSPAYGILPEKSQPEVSRRATPQEARAMRIVDLSMTVEECDE